MLAISAIEPGSPGEKRKRNSPFFETKGRGSERVKQRGVKQPETGRRSVAKRKPLWRKKLRLKEIRK